MTLKKGNALPSRTQTELHDNNKQKKQTKTKKVDIFSELNRFIKGEVTQNKQQILVA